MQDTTATRRILIADDEERIRFCLSLALRMKGYEVLEVPDGEKALRMIVEERSNGRPFDLLICDIRMPVMDGERLFDRLDELGSSLPVIVITGYGDKDLVVRLMRRGCRDFIDKPFEPEAIHLKVEALLDDIDRNRAREKANAHNARTGTRALVHDLNNLLGGAVGYADLALENCRCSECPSAYIEKILASTSLAARVCRSILARGVDDEENGPILTTTEIATVVERAGAAIAGIAPDNITVAVEVNECQLWMQADAQLLQRAILNLAINAMDAMPEGGTLRISLRKSRQQAARDIEPTDRVVIAVADTGHGIAPETLGHLFDEGYTTKPHGHGLGLPAVKAVAEGHGGGVEIAGSEGGGTVVTLILPLDGTSDAS